MTGYDEEATGRPVRIAHVFLPDVDPRDHRLLRITDCGERMVGLTVVERSEDVPVVEKEIASIVVDLEPLWNSLRAMILSEGEKPR